MHVGACVSMIQHFVQQRLSNALNANDTNSSPRGLCERAQTNEQSSASAMVTRQQLIKISAAWENKTDPTTVKYPTGIGC